MIESEPELYVPKPGSIPWRVLNFFLENPNEEMTRGDIAVQFDCVGGGVDAILQIGVARECLKKTRNNKGEVVWILGLVKRFRLDPYTADDRQVEELRAAINPAPAPAVAEPYRAIKVVEAPAKWTANQKPTGPAPFPGEKVARAAPAPKAIIVAAPAPAVAPTEVVTLTEFEPPPVAVAPIQLCGPDTVAMPKHLTHELIEAVKADPSTSFDCKSDMHHAIGWLSSAYEVMVKANMANGSLLSNK